MKLFSKNSKPRLDSTCGWRGANVNQSLKALEWLYYWEQQIPKQGASVDRIKHVRNGGEQSIQTSVTSYFVDGYNATMSAVYEFHGCLYHGFPTCYPTRDALRTEPWRNSIRPH